MALDDLGLITVIGPGPDRLTAREWAEALWLARRVSGRPGITPQRRDAAPPLPPEAPPTPPGPQSEPPPSPRPRLPAGNALPRQPTSVPGPAPASARAGIAAGPQTGTAGPLFDADPRPGALRDPLGLARALRPFNRRVRTHRNPALDEEATAVRSAELGRWDLVLTDLPDRWFEVTLVVERSTSMSVWYGIVRDLVRLLRNQGAFADVRVCWLDTRGGGAVLRAESGSATCGPAALTHPRRSRLILLMSDCVGAGWAQGVVPRLLRSWAREAPVAVLQPLPARLWDLCEAVPVDLRLRTRAPGLPNSLLELRRGGAWVRPGDADDAGEEPVPVPVPVLAMEPAWLAGWARLVTAAPAPHHDVAALLIEGGHLATASLPPLEPEARGAAVPADTAVRRFQRLASPAGRLLAARLAMVPLRDDVLSAVREPVTRMAGPLPMAEILLGGLLSMRPEPGSSRPSFAFLEGVRGQLLRTLGRAEILRTLQEVAARAAQVTGARPDLLAELVAAPSSWSPERLSDEDRELLEAAGPALSALGPAYSTPLDRVTGPLVRGADGQETPGGTSTSGPPATRPADAPAMTTRPAPASENALKTPAEQSGSAHAAGTPTEPHSAREEPAPPGRTPPSMPLAGRHFFGRSPELARLHGILHGEGQAAVLPHALYGLGGVGKTRLAIEYARRHSGEYDRVWWIDAAQTAVIREQLASLAAELGVAEGPGDTVERVLAALSSGDSVRRWLLVLDNAGPPESVAPYIPSPVSAPGRVGHVILTSRDAGWTNRVDSLRVDVFNQAESREFLRSRTPWVSEADADRLAEELGHLPIALEQCAALMIQTGLGTGELLELLASRPSELLAETASPGDRSVAKLWRASMDSLARDHPGALDLLRLLAFFGPEPVAQSFLPDARALPLPASLFALAHDPLERGRTIRAINQYSLLTIDQERGTAQMHRLLRGFLQNELPAREQEAWRHLIHQMLAAHDPGASQRTDAWARLAEILPHIEPTGLPRSTDGSCRQTVLTTLGYLFARGDFQGTVEFARRIVTEWREILGPDHPQTLSAMRLQASAHWQLSQFGESRPLNQEALRLLRATVGDDHEDTITVAGATAADERAAGHFEEALILDRGAYERSVRRYGEESANTLRATHNYAVSLRVNGYYTEALELDRRVHESRRTVLGHRARSTLFSVNNVARDLRECGRYAEALRLQRTTLAVYREEFGETHPDTLRALKNLAVSCRKAGALREGLELATDVHERYEKLLGGDHVDTIAAVTNLANDLRLTGDPEGAVRCGADALERYRARFGERHPITSTAAVNYAAALRAGGADDQALALDERTVSSLARALPEDHPWLLMARVNLASGLSRAGERARARALGEECADRLERRYGDRHPVTLVALLNLALDLVEAGVDERDRGEDLLATVHRRYLDTLGPDHPEARGAAARRRGECDIEPPPL
ncbi:FxSxx-COOH system tetratricopeptide repeat protein [Streptomyces sp. DSM 44917]|uniref:FxSxx-COOH system tetratricopeptide repeat protein n=1 Tax=Streptomyces boetiae TaxID=3075541 RepID=A0ABU2LG54_9ACTN|nr:FxSxx-COOH system tetratricopeptide repeat protein [Streptomyces sp. DSM 44917]MDT0310527.1 FxSxx-COOH system tetratricopeptide repeat protein [Streptomyces sp. DSM 44917]